MNNKLMGTPEITAAQQNQNRSIGQQVWQWLRTAHADKLRVVDPFTETWVRMTEVKESYE